MSGRRLSFFEMKIAFFGTPDYVLPVLTSIHKKFVTGPGKSPIVAVITQSPKPVGREKMVTYSPVDKWAHSHKVPIYYSARDLIKNPPDATLGVLASYGEIIKKEVIDLFPQGILVIHPSLLPKYRGASPVPFAIANGDSETGVSIIKMDEKVDHGPIISQFKEEVLLSDTGETLRRRLFEKSALVLVELLEPYVQGKIKPRVQNDSEATFTKILTREGGFINLTEKTSAEAERFIRAMSPWPGAWTWVTLEKGGQKKRIKLLKSHLENDKLILDEVQLEGKLPVSWKQFKEGYADATFEA
jgi:methionyl-tRNA formyltransferase